MAKMLLILAALANIGLFHRRLGSDPFLEREGESPRWARWGAGLSLGFWIAVAALGRMIAYV